MQRQMLIQFLLDPVQPVIAAVSGLFDLFPQGGQRRLQVGQVILSHLHHLGPHKVRQRQDEDREHAERQLEPSEDRVHGRPPRLGIFIPDGLVAMVLFRNIQESASGGSDPPALGLEQPEAVGERISPRLKAAAQEPAESPVGHFIEPEERNHDPS